MQINMTEVSEYELMVAKLRASNWPLELIDKFISPAENELNRHEMITELAQDFQHEIVSILNYHSVITKLDQAFNKALTGGDYSAAVTAAAEMVKLLPLIPKS